MKIQNMALCISDFYYASLSEEIWQNRALGLLGTDNMHMSFCFENKYILVWSNKADQTGCWEYWLQDKPSRPQLLLF